MPLINIDSVLANGRLEEVIKGQSRFEKFSCELRRSEELREVLRRLEQRRPKEAGEGLRRP